MNNQKDPSLYTVPPQNIEAEQSILSAILIDNNVLLDVIELLVTEDFYKSAHQKIYSAIIDLFDKGEPVDLDFLHCTYSSLLHERG